jgi:DNA-binding transcriptional MerR regulator
MKYRVDELAARSGVSVDTVRYYQSRGLLPAPQREGRVAYYADDHLERLERIRSLKDRGLSLAVIKRLVDESVDADEVLAAAVDSGVDEGGGRWLTLDEVAAATGVSPALLEAVEREGLLLAYERDGVRHYTEDDARAVAAGLELLEAGLPLGELLDLARYHNEVMHSVARRAVELFVKFVRDPIHASATTEHDAAERLLDAFRSMLPATTTLVASHFRRVLLAEALERMEGEGLPMDEEAARLAVESR